MFPVRFDGITQNYRFGLQEFSLRLLLWRIIIIFFFTLPTGLDLLWLMHRIIRRKNYGKSGLLCFCIEKKNSHITRVCFLKAIGIKVF